MTGSPHRRNALLDALGDLVVRIGAGGGFMLGLLAGLHGHPRAVACPADDVCVGEQLAAAMAGVLVPAFSFAFAGLAASLVVVLLLKQLRPRSTRRQRPDRRWITARYAGHCRRCSGGVQPGDRVLWEADTSALTCSACAS